jgi:hypothetical protein
MTLRKRSNRESTTEKKMWISYRLQSLSTKRFIVVTNKIIRGEHLLISLPKLAEPLEG